MAILNPKPRIVGAAFVEPFRFDDEQRRALRASMGKMPDCEKDEIIKRTEAALTDWFFLENHPAARATAAQIKAELATVEAATRRLKGALNLITTDTRRYLPNFDAVLAELTDLQDTAAAHHESLKIMVKRGRSSGGRVELENRIQAIFGEEAAFNDGTRLQNFFSELVQILKTG